jgi:hypothetical protein
MKPSPRAKRALLQHCRPTPALNRIGILALGDRFDLRLAAILARTPFLLGTAVGTNGEGPFFEPRRQLQRSI